MSHKKSAFEIWFVAQHGKRPVFPSLNAQLTQVTTLNSDTLRLRILVSIGERAAQVLRAQEVWDEQFESALHAWQVSDANKTLASVKRMVKR